MEKYHKINTIFKRDEKGDLMPGCFSTPEFEYLKDNRWVFTEKVDGTNVRVIWEGGKLRFGGKTDNAQMPISLIDRLNELFTAEKMLSVFPETDVCLYGEGYGAKIQKGGGNYNPNGVDFVLFDVKIGEWWLRREDVFDVALKLNIGAVPVIGAGTLADAVDIARGGFDSLWGPFKAEGIVLRPMVEMFDRNGQRIIAKIKHRDFRFLQVGQALIDERNAMTEEGR